MSPACSTAMVLAAGLGTRLRPLTDAVPKPLVPIGDRPAIAHVLDRLARDGVAKVTVNTHHLSDRFSELTRNSPIPLSMLHEPELLGTAGGLAGARSVLGTATTLVWNGDIAADVDVAALSAHHAERARAVGAAATLLVAPCAAGEGTVGLDGEGRVVRLRGERFGEEVRGGEFLGIHVVGAELVRELPPRGCLVGDVYLPALRGGATLASIDFDGEWDDIGSIAAYARANRRWLRRSGLESFVGPDATIGPGVRIVATVVGAGARIDGEGEVSECIVWPGTTARAPLNRVIVWSSTEPPLPIPASPGRLDFEGGTGEVTM